jgi:hypothetical protein
MSSFMLPAVHARLAAVRLAVRAAQQHREQQRLALVQPVRALAEQSRDAAAIPQFAAECREIQVASRIWLCSRPFQLLRRLDLVPLLRHGALLPARAQRIVQVRSHLHGDSRGAARLREQQRIECGVRQRQPVHAAVLVEALVLGTDDCGQRRGRNFRERGPLQAPAALDHPQLVDQHAVAVEHHAVSAGPARSDCVEVGIPASAGVGKPQP